MSGLLQGRLNSRQILRDVLGGKQDISIQNALLTSPTEPLGIVSAGKYGSLFPAMGVRAFNGDILVLTRAGDTHSEDYGKIVQFRSKDLMKTWSEEAVFSLSNRDCRNVGIAGVLTNGRIIFSFSDWDLTGDWKTRTLYSDDNGATWGTLAGPDPAPSDTFFGGNNLLAIRDDLLFTAHEDGDNTKIQKSTDGGVTATLIKTYSLAGQNLSEPYLQYLPEISRIVCIMRNDLNNYLHIGYSDDLGTTWSDAYRTPFGTVAANAPLGHIGNRIFAAFRTRIYRSAGVNFQHQGRIILYATGDGLLWEGNRTLYSIPTTVTGDKGASLWNPVNYGSFLELAPGTGVYFFGTEHWVKEGTRRGFDAGIFYAIIRETDADRFTPLQAQLFNNKATANAYADSPALDVTGFKTMNFVIHNVHATAGLHWRLDGAIENPRDLGEAWIEIKAEASLAAGAEASYAVTTPWRWVRGQVKSAVADTPSSAFMYVYGAK